MDRKQSPANQRLRAEAHEKLDELLDYAISIDKFQGDVIVEVYLSGSTCQHVKGTTSREIKRV